MRALNYIEALFGPKKYHVETYCKFTLWVVSVIGSCYVLGDIVVREGKHTYVILV